MLHIMYTYPYLNKTKGKCIHSIVVLIIKRIYKTLHIKSIFTLINATYQIHDFGFNINLIRLRTVLMETKAIMSEMFEMSYCTTCDTASGSTPDWELSPD